MAKRPEKPEPAPNGRPPHKPTDQTRQLVKTLVVAGWNHDRIGEVVGCTGKPLRRHYREELDESKAKADAMVTQCLLMQAVGGPERNWKEAVPSATIFYAKTRMGWKEPAQAVEHSGPQGGPVQIENITDAMRARALAAFMAKTRATGGEK